MDHINQIIDAADFTVMIVDEIEAKAAALSLMATDLRKEAYGVVRNSPKSSRMDFGIDENKDIKRLV